MYISDMIGFYLTKLRNGLSTKSVSHLLNICTPSKGYRIIEESRKLLMQQFVDKEFGLNNISRQDIISKETSLLSEKLFGQKNKLIVVCDGTYIYIQKSSNYDFQKKSYSTHKGRSLLKMMILVSTTGYIIDVYGPYLSNNSNNDASILKHIYMNEKNINQFFKAEDILIVDRGFRDSIEFLESLNLHVEMPAFLYKKKQHTVEEANKSRLITKIRWIVESVNGLIKKWKYFANIVPNVNIPVLQDDIRIICALINKYKTIYHEDKKKSLLIAKNILAKVDQENKLKEYIDNFNSKKSKKKYLKVDTFIFPQLTDEYIRNLTFGVYQLKQSKSYLKQHQSEDGIYGYEFFLIKENIVETRIKSRHSSYIVYRTYVEYNLKSKKDPIIGWYCTCRSGVRVVGACAHVTSVLWYLGIVIYDNSLLAETKSDFFIDFCKNAKEKSNSSKISNKENEENDEPEEISDEE